MLPAFDHIGVPQVDASSVLVIYPPFSTLICIPHRGVTCIMYHVVLKGILQCVQRLLPGDVIR
jgi:hypothetical protein